MKTFLRTMLILLIVGGLVAGGVYGYSRYTKSQPVAVQSAGNWLLEYAPNQTYLGGSVVSGDSLTIYPDKDRTILEVFVAEGQTVKAGDPLLRYDTTKDTLDLDEKLLERQKLYDELEDLYKDYRRYARKPYERAVPTATPTFTPTPRGYKGTSADTQITFTVTRLSAPVMRDLGPIGDNEGRTPDNPVQFNLKEGQPLPARDIGTLKTLARDRNSTVYARFQNESFWYLDMVIRPDGVLSFTVTGRPGNDQANFIDPISGNGRSIETARTFAYRSGTEVPAAFLADCAEEARNTSSFLYVKLRSGYLSILMVFDTNGDMLVIIPAQAEPTPTPAPTPTPTAAPTPTPTPTPTATPEGWEDDPDQPYVPAPQYVMSREERQALVTEITQKIRDGELSYKQLCHDIDILRNTSENGTLTSDVDGVVTKLDPQAKTGEALLEVRGGSGKGVISCMLGETELEKYPVGTELTGFSYDIGDSVTAVVTYVSPMPVTDSYSNGGNPNSSGYTMLLEVQGDVELPLYSYVEFTSFEPLSKSGAIYLYEAFVREIDGQDCIFVARDGVLRKVQVHTGRRMMEYIELIGSDLTRDDYIAFPYGKNVRDGAPTEITDNIW